MIFKNGSLKHLRKTDFAKSEPSVKTPLGANCFDQ